YAIDDLGTGIPAAINGRGQVAGAFAGFDGMRAFVWTDGVRQELGTALRISSATGINDAGDVAGWSDRGRHDPHAVVWQAGTMGDLGVLGPGYSYAYGINQAGEVVGGTSFAPDGPGQVAFVAAGGTMKALDPGVAATAYAINDSEQVAGVLQSASGQPH